MSKLWTVLLSFALAAFAWFGWLSFRGVETNNKLTKSLVVVQMTGTAGVSNGLSGQTRPLKIGSPVADNDEVAVSAGGVVDLSSPDGSRIRIEGPARVKIDAFRIDSHLTSLQVLAGVFRTYVSKAAGSGSYVVKSASAVAGVRGTVFTLTVDADGATLEVAEGAVDFKNVASEGGMLTIPAGSVISAIGEGYSEIGELDQIQRAKMTLIKDIAAAEIPTLSKQILKLAQGDVESIITGALALLGQSGQWQMPAIELPELPSGEGDGQSGQSIQAQIDMKAIFNELAYLYMKNGSAPESMNLDAKDVPSDPWGELYQYEKLGANQFKLYSKGQDKTAGTPDDVVFPRSHIQ